MPEADEPDFIEESLTLAPEPYRTLIKKRLDEGFFASMLKRVQERFSLNEDQIDTVTLITFRTACDPDSMIDSLKDTLIAEADLSYEQAVKIERDIIRDIILPIKEEGEALEAVAQPSAPSAGGAVDQSPSHPLFSDRKAIVTERTVQIGGATYPVGTLARSVGPFLVPHMGFIGDILNWGDWYVAVHFIDGEERTVFWKTRDEADRFAQALHSVMS
jgi:hypothetical protein